jgi:uncharacterized protein YkwD
VDERERLLVELNRVRGTGCACAQASHPVARDPRLDQAAQLHSEEMARRGMLDHVGLQGQSPFDRVRAAGYAFRAAAENIASGNADASRTLTQWLNSSGHCQNMMSALYVHVGIGHAMSASGQHYWTMDLAAPG